MGVKLIFFSLLFDFRYLTGYERKEFKANSCEKKAWKRFSAVDDAVDYSQLSPCGHPAITDTPIIRTADKFRAKINYRHLTEINSRYYGLLLQRTLT